MYGAQTRSHLLPMNLQHAHIERMANTFVLSLFVNCRFRHWSVPSAFLDMFRYCALQIHLHCGETFRLNLSRHRTASCLLLTLSIIITKVHIQLSFYSLLLLKVFKSFFFNYLAWVNWSEHERGTHFHCIKSQKVVRYTATECTSKDTITTAQ